MDDTREEDKRKSVLELTKQFENSKIVISALPKTNDQSGHVLEMTIDKNDVDTTCDSTQLFNSPIYNTPKSNNPIPNNPKPINPISNNPIPNNPKPISPISNNPIPNNPISNNPIPNNPKPINPISSNPIPNNPKPINPISSNPIPNNPKPINPISNNPIPNNPKPINPISNNPISNNPIPNNPKPINPISNNPIPNNPNPISPISNKPIPKTPKPINPISNKPIPSNPKPSNPKPNNPKPISPKSNNPMPNSPKSNNSISDNPKSNNPISISLISNSLIAYNSKSDNPETSHGCTFQKKVSTPTLSPNVNTDEELWVVFMGFPSSIQSDQVAECVSKATGARVNRVAPLNMVPASDRSLPSSWIASLQSHNGEMDWSVQNEISVEYCGQTCTVQCSSLTTKYVHTAEIDCSEASDSQDLIYENQFSLKAQDLQNQHLLIKRHSSDNSTADTQELQVHLINIDDAQIDDDIATLYFPNHKIRYKSKWKWNEGNQELCVQAVDLKDYKVHGKLREEKRMKTLKKTGRELDENGVTTEVVPDVMSQEGESPISCTVEVQGFEPQDAENWRLYFEHSLEDKGKEIVHLSMYGDKMYITFKTSKAAEEQVTEMTHQCINGRNVQVSRLAPPCPVYPNMLLLKNVRGFTNMDHLSRYLESITALQPQGTVLGERPGIVLVKFEENACIDFKKVTELVNTTKFQGQQISVSPVPISNCMLVENVSPGSTEKDVLDCVKSFIPPDLLTDDPTSAIEEVKLIKTENKCFVFFKDFKVLDRIMIENNTWNYNDWIIKHYMQCLEANGDCEMLTTFIKPEAFILTHNDPYKMAYLQHSHKAQEELMIQLVPLHAKLKIEDNSVIVDCTLTSSVFSAHALTRTWAHFVQLAINKYMNQLKVYKLKIIHAIWHVIQSYVEQINHQNNGDAIFFMQLTRRIVIVVGKDTAREMFQRLIKTVKDIETEKVKKEISETETFFKRFQLQLLKIVNFQDKIHKHNNGITINICPDKRGISFTGFPDDVKTAHIQTVRVLNLVKSSNMADKSRTYRHILSSNQTCELLAKKFSDRNIFAVLDTSGNNIMIYAFSYNEITNARRCIQETIVEHVYSVKLASTYLLSSEEWHDIIQAHLFRNPGKLHISNCNQTHQFLLTGTDDIMADVIKSIDVFVNENTVYSEEYCLSPSRQKFVTIHMRDKLKSIAASLTKFKVEIFQVKERNKVICVKGTEKGLNLMMTKLQSLGQEIACHVTVVDDPVRMKFFTEESNTRLNLFERSSKCVVGFNNEPHVLKVVKSDRCDVMGDVCYVGDVKIISSVQLTEGVTISLVHGELSRMVVDAIVSETNEQMENFKEIAATTANSSVAMSEGEIITSGSGQFSCKHVIYAVSILYKNGKSGEDKRLFETITNCLETADTLGCTSIALPALGSSTCSSNYPLTECTSVVVEAVRAYMEIRSNNNVSEIYLCAHDSDCVKHFSTAMQNASADSKIRKSDSTFTIKTPRNQNSLPVISVTLLEGNITKQQELTWRKAPRLTLSSGTVFFQYARDMRVADVIKPTITCVVIIILLLVLSSLWISKADVIVNSTSCDLNLSNGAVSSSILAAGGRGLQDECRTKYPQGIPVGGIARTSGHDLCCKEVFHVALCDFKTSNAKQILESLVTNCLKEASESNYSTLAFPALGSGVLGYPLDVVSSTMIRAIDAFKKTTTSTSIRNVKVVIFQDKETIKKFQAGFDQIYKQLAGRDDTLGRRFHYQTVSECTSNSNVISKNVSHTRASVFWIGSFECVMYDLRVMIKQADITEEHVDAIVNCTSDDLDLNTGAVSRVLKAKGGTDLETECKDKVSEMQTNGICSTNAFNLKCKIIIHVSSRMYHADLEGGVKAILKEADKLCLCSIAFPALGTGCDHGTSEESAKAVFRALVSFCKGKRKTLNEVRVILPDNSTISPFVSVIQAKSEKLKDRIHGIGNLFKGKRESTSLGSLTTVNSLHQAARIYVYAVSKNDVKRLLDDVGLVKPSHLRSTVKTSEIYGKSRDIRSFYKGQFSQVTSQMTSPRKKDVTLLAEKHADNKDVQEKLTTLPVVVHLPKFWTAQGPDEKVKRCPLLASDEEYKTVEKNLRASLGQAKINIVTIERIQNPDLYTHYMHKRKQMESQNADIPGIPNERILWHGTDFAAIPCINHHGFNRSYCGKNATAFGEGVYFAAHSEYSVNPLYSPKDSLGRRYMYQCKVLTGHSTKGKLGLRVLPSRSGVILYDSATDSLEKPKVYVIFNDYQAYPEYLILFTRKD